VGAIILGVLLGLMSPETLEDTNETVLGLLTIPIGIFTCWLTYTLLKKAWSKPRDIQQNTLDAGMISHQDDDRYMK
jgi:hypothetical protein